MARNQQSVRRTDARARRWAGRLLLTAAVGAGLWLCAEGTSVAAERPSDIVHSAPSTPAKSPKGDVKSTTAPRPTKEYVPPTQDAPQQGSTEKHQGGLLDGGLLGGVVKDLTAPLTGITKPVLDPVQHPTKPDDGTTGDHNGPLLPPVLGPTQPQDDGNYTTQEITGDEVAKLQRPSNRTEAQWDAEVAAKTAATKTTTHQDTSDAPTPAEQPSTVDSEQTRQHHEAPTKRAATTTSTNRAIAASWFAPVEPTHIGQAFLDAHGHPGNPGAPEQLPVPLPAPPTVSGSHGNPGGDRHFLAVLPQHDATAHDVARLAWQGRDRQATSALLGLPNASPD